MASSKFWLYTSAAKYIAQGNIDLVAGTILAIPLHRGYTPGTASHSALAQIVAFQSTASATIINALACALTVTASGDHTVKVDAADLAGFSAGGDTFGTKYVALYAQSASGGSGDNLLIGFFDTAVGVTTGVEGTQVNVTWPAGGAFKFNVNS